MSARLSASRGPGDPLAQAVAKQGHQHLRASVDAHALLPECQRRAVTQAFPRREFTKQRFADVEGETGVAAGDRVADAVAFSAVEEQDLVGLCNGLLMSNVAHIDAPVWKHEMG